MLRVLREFLLSSTVVVGRYADRGCCLDVDRENLKGETKKVGVDAQNEFNKSTSQGSKRA